MDKVILVYVKDYEVDGELNVWNVYSSEATHKQIHDDLLKARRNGEIGNGFEWKMEEWSLYDKLYC